MTNPTLNVNITLIVVRILSSESSTYSAALTCLLHSIRVLQESELLKSSRPVPNTSYIVSILVMQPRRLSGPNVHLIITYYKY